MRRRHADAVYCIPYIVRDDITNIVNWDYIIYEIADIVVYDVPDISIVVLKRS